MTWIDGSMYKGAWAHGIQHGYGTMIFPDGQIKQGQFDNNIFIGPTRSVIKEETGEDGTDEL